MIEGNGGDDVLIGSYGDDSLIGDSGVDYLSGGSGNDALYGDYSSDAMSPFAPTAQVDYGDVLDGGVSNDLHGYSSQDYLKAGSCYKLAA